MRKQADKDYRERDLCVPEIKETVQASKNLFKTLNQKNPKRLADWDFDVHDSVQTPKPPKAK